MHFLDTPSDARALASQENRIKSDKNAKICITDEKAIGELEHLKFYFQNIDGEVLIEEEAMKWVVVSDMHTGNTVNPDSATEIGMLQPILFSVVLQPHSLFSTPTPFPL